MCVLFGSHQPDEHAPRDDSMWSVLMDTPADLEVDDVRRRARVQACACDQRGTAAPAEPDVAQGVEVRWHDQCQTPIHELRVASVKGHVAVRRNKERQADVEQDRAQKKDVEQYDLHDVVVEDETDAGACNGVLLEADCAALSVRRAALCHFLEA